MGSDEDRQRDPGACEADRRGCLVDGRGSYGRDHDPDDARPTQSVDKPEQLLLGSDVPPPYLRWAASERRLSTAEEVRICGRFWLRAPTLPEC